MHDPSERAALEKLSLTELQDLVMKLLHSMETERIDAVMAITEVSRRLAVQSDETELAALKILHKELSHWLVLDDRRLGRNEDDSGPPRNCGMCMCSIAREESRGKQNT